MTPVTTEFTRSDEGNHFSAPRNIDLGLNNYDCGLSTFPRLTQWLKLDRFAKIWYFIGLVSVLGCLQGISFSYFFESSEVWRRFFRLDVEIVEWIIHFGDMFAGIFGLLISYWGNRHRPSWLGGLTVIHAICGISLIVPEIYHPAFKTTIPEKTFDNICNKTSNVYLMDAYSPEASGTSYIAVGLFIIYQFFYASALVSYISHSISYIDDHSSYKNSATNICIILVSKEIGRQIGIYLSFVPVVFNRYTFFSFSWLTLMLLLLVFGTLVSMFSKVLPSKITRDGAESILNIAEHVELTEPAKTPGYFAQTKVLFKNRILMLNVFSGALVGVAVINFDLLKDEVARSKTMADSFSNYYLPDQMKFVSDHFIHTVKIAVMVLTAIVISKARPSGKTLATWLCFIYFLIALLFFIFLFVRCDLKMKNQYNDFMSFCNVKCHCDYKAYQPVCGTVGSERVTYYSPCFAGCTTKSGTDFSNCECLNNGSVVPGFCSSGRKCQVMWFLTETNNVVRAALVASGVIIHTFLALKAVPKVYTALAVGMNFGLGEVTPYAPFKVLFDLLGDAFCEHKNYNDQCTTYNHHLSYYVHSIATALVVIAALLALWLIKVVDDINLYYDEEEETQNERLSYHERPNSVNRRPLIHVNDDENYDYLRDDPARVPKPTASWNTNYSESDICDGLQYDDDDNGSVSVTRDNETSL